MKTEAKVFCIIFGSALILAMIAATLIIVFDIEPSTGPTFATSYETISIADAKLLAVSMGTVNLTVADIRGLEGCGQCQFNKGHLPGAGRYTNPVSLYNSTNDILVYSVDGTKGAWFCEQLVGYVYGKIYNLEGGWNGWRQS